MKHAFLVVLFFSQIASAKFDNFGYEFELTPRQFSNIIDWYAMDLNQFRAGIQSLVSETIQRKRFLTKLQEEAFTSLIYGLEHYAENTDAVNALPTEVKDALLKGLNTDMKIETAKNLEQASRQKQKPTYEKDGGLWLPSSSGFKSSGGLFVPENLRAKTDFAELQRRWSEIPLEKKLEIVDLNLLPRATRAALAIYGMGSEPMHSVHLKPNAPQVLQDLEFVQDGESWEFRPKVPIVGYEKFISHIKTFSQMVGLYTQVFSTGDPRDFRNDDVSLHVHMSTNADRNLSKITEKLNFLLLVRNLSRGDQSDIKSIGSFAAYNTRLSARGRLRLINPQRIEARLFISGLEEEMALYNSVLEMSEEEALAMLNNKIKSLVSVEMVETVSKSINDRLAILFLEYLNPKDTEPFEKKILEKMQHQDYILKVSGKGILGLIDNNKFRVKLIVQSLRNFSIDIKPLVRFNSESPLVQLDVNELNEIFETLNSVSDSVSRFSTRGYFNELIADLTLQGALVSKHIYILEKIIQKLEVTRGTLGILEARLRDLKMRHQPLTCKNLF